jgi:hypothetical protein
LDDVCESLEGDPLWANEHGLGDALVVEDTGAGEVADGRALRGGVGSAEPQARDGQQVGRADSKVAAALRLAAAAELLGRLVAAGLGAGVASVHVERRAIVGVLDLALGLWAELDLQAVVSLHNLCHLLVEEARVLPGRAATHIQCLGGQVEGRNVSVERAHDFFFFCGGFGERETPEKKSAISKKVENF